MHGDLPIVDDLGCSGCGALSYIVDLDRTGPVVVEVCLGRYVTHWLSAAAGRRTAFCSWGQGRDGQSGAERSTAQHHSTAEQSRAGISRSCHQSRGSRVGGGGRELSCGRSGATFALDLELRCDFSISFFVVRAALDGVRCRCRFVSRFLTFRRTCTVFVLANLVEVQ